MKPISLQKLLLMFILAGVVLFGVSRGFAHAGIRGGLYLGFISLIASIPALLLIFSWKSFGLSFKACAFVMFLLCGIAMPMLPERSIPSWQREYFENAKAAERILRQLDLDRFPGLTTSFHDPMRDEFRGLPFIRISGTIESQARLNLLLAEVETLKIQENQEFGFAWSVKIEETGEFLERTYWNRESTKP